MLNTLDKDVAIALVFSITFAVIVLMVCISVALYSYCEYRRYHSKKMYEEIEDSIYRLQRQIDEITCYKLQENETKKKRGKNNE